MTRARPISETITVHVPFHIVKRGGRKEMVWPNNKPDKALLPRKTDAALIKAIARAFRWQRMLESGEFTTISELADREKIASTYMTRVMRLSLLSPATVETILEGRQPPTVTLSDLLKHIPPAWDAQLSRYDIGA
jgi:hypothetical protein